MKRTQQIILSLCCLVFSVSAPAEHQTYLRGIVSLPGFQAALLEIHHTLAVRSNAPPIINKTSRWVRAGEQFEDKTIKGAYFQFEVRELDVGREIVKTREGGEDHIYSLFAPEHPATDSWFHLQDAPFNDVIDLCSELENRALLLHPAIDRAPVSLAMVWTNQAPEKAEAGDALLMRLRQRDIAVVVDGERFLQLLPSALVPTASQRSKDLPGAPAEFRATFVAIEIGKVVEVYAATSGRHRTGNERVPGKVPYFKIHQAISKPEALYALETLLAWHGAKVVLGGDNTFSLVPTSQSPR